ncbi:MAG: hypothetical protein GF398_00315 [Chitinivibrionales bacterium]|nr:hypothetical protein [Chitinivibrionales bacterium]
MQLFVRATLALLSITALISAQIPARISVDKNEVDNFCGTGNVKLVFTWNEELYLVNFADATPAITKMDNVSDAAIPVISPDGQWVTFATGTNADGATYGPSTAWVSRLHADGQPMRVSDSGAGFVPRFVGCMLDTPQVIYSTRGYKLANREYAWQGSGQVVAKRVVNNNIEANATVFHDGGSYFGGISYDKRYLGTAENRRYVHLLDLQGASDQPHRVHEFPVRDDSTGQVSTTTIQTCNSSMSSSRTVTDAIMYVDFGLHYDQCNCTSAMGDWTFHSRLFISRSDNTILRIYDVPEAPVDADSADAVGEIVQRQWSYPEWSNHPYFAVAAVLNDRLYTNTGIPPIIHKQRRESIAVINLKDSTYFTIIEATDTSKSSDANFSFPGLWVEMPDGFVEQASWLGKVDVRNLAQQPLRQFAISFDGRTVTAERALKSVAFFNASGRCSAHFGGGNRKRFSLPHSVSLTGGVSFIRAVAQDNTQRVVRILSLQ